MLFRSRDPYYRLMFSMLKESKTHMDVESFSEQYAKIDDSKFFDICSRNEVESIIGAELEKFILTEYPNDWFASCEATRQKITSYIREICFVGNEFARLGIPLVVLKNGGIAIGLSDDYAKCPMGDLDTLVQKDDFLAAHAALISLGYVFRFRSELEEEDIGLAFREGSTEYYKDLPGNVRLWFELSWRPVSGRWIRPDQEPDAVDLFSRSVSVGETGLRM